MMNAPADKTTPTKKTAPQTSNTKKGSLVKVVVDTDEGKWLSPEKGSTHKISSIPEFPRIVFSVDTAQTGPLKWKWSLVWNAKVSGLRESAQRGKQLHTYSLHGEFESDAKSWEANIGVLVGGVLTVEVTAGSEHFRRSVNVVGTNPSDQEIDAYLATLADVVGLKELAMQESKGKNFIEADGQPIVSFDKGYGLMQLTNPAPSFLQIWNWKENISAGAKLYQEKQRIAKRYLGSSSRTYTAEELKLETWARWNGSTYHKWDVENKRWIRNNSVLCDTKTGNIGWDMSAPDNEGKSEKELHERDEATYKKPPKSEDRKWIYSGMCYADHVNTH